MKHRAWKTRVICLLLALVFAVTAFPAVRVEASTGSEALRAYMDLLNSKVKWSDDLTLSPEEMEFFVYDIDKNGVKELILYAPTAKASDKPVRIYTYKSGKLDMVLSSKGDVTIYANDGVVLEETASKGVYSDTWYQMSKGTLKEKASRDGVDSSLASYIPSSAKDIIKEKGVFFYKFRKDGESVGYSEYRKCVKSLKNDNKTVKWNLHTNTKTNRNKYLR